MTKWPTGSGLPTIAMRSELRLGEGLETSDPGSAESLGTRDPGGGKRLRVGDPGSAESLATRDPGSVVPLTPAVFHIMLALAERDLHGYGIKLEVGKLTEGRIRLGSGTLYRSLQRMIVEGMVERLEEGADSHKEDDRRVDYRLTEFGRRVAEEEARRLALLVEAAMVRQLLPGWLLRLPQGEGEQRRELSDD